MRSYYNPPTLLVGVENDTATFEKLVWNTLQSLTYAYHRTQQTYY